jgi:hypothetical protein
VSATVERKSPTVSRRYKLTGKIEDQIRYAKVLTAGVTYAAKRVRFVQDANSGERKQVEIATRVKQWWWTAANGKVVLALRYGSKPIELAKGKNAIEVGNIDALIGHSKQSRTPFMPVNSTRRSSRPAARCAKASRKRSDLVEKGHAISLQGKTARRAFRRKLSRYASKAGNEP